MSEMMGVVVRKVVRDDVDSLLSLLIESNSSLKITRASLERDLACGNELELIDAQQVLNEQKKLEDDATTFELDLKLAKSNVPAVQGFLAEVSSSKSSNSEDKTAGFVLFHYHYSPWSGRLVFINNLYVRPEHRNKGIAKSMLNELCSLCKQESIVKLLYEASRMPKDLLARVDKYGTRVYRNDDTDWCVFRINFS